MTHYFFILFPSCFFPNPPRRGRLGAGISAHCPGLPPSGLLIFCRTHIRLPGQRPRSASELPSFASALMPVQGDPDKKPPVSFFSLLSLASSPTPRSGSPRGRHLRASPRPASCGPVDILSNPYPLARSATTLRQRASLVCSALMPAQGDPDKKRFFLSFRFSLLPLPQPPRRGRLWAGISAHRPGLPPSSLLIFCRTHIRSPRSARTPRQRACLVCSALMPAQGDPDKKPPFSFFSLLSLASSPTTLILPRFGGQLVKQPF